MSVRDIAAKLNADGLVLYRMLRRVSMKGFFRELPAKDLLDHRFQQTPASDVLRASFEPSARWCLIHWVDDLYPTFAHFDTLHNILD